MQWAPSDLNRERSIAVGATGLEAVGKNSEIECQNIGPIDFQNICQLNSLTVRKHAKKNVRKVPE